MTTKEMSQKYHVGIALSGGGVRGFAHIGALRALEDMGIVPQALAGVSAGSVVAAFYAAGLKADEIYRTMNDADLKSFIQVDLSGAGFFKLDRFSKFLEQSLPVTTFDELKTPLFVGTTNISRQEATVFTKGELVPCIKASCSIPVVFRPVLIDGDYYADGGIMHNLPAGYLRPMCRYVIGINVSPSLIGEVKLDLRSLAYRSYKIMTQRNVLEDKQLCDVLIDLKAIQGYGTFALTQRERIARMSYFETMKILKNHPLINNIIHADK